MAVSQFLDTVPVSCVSQTKDMWKRDANQNFKTVIANQAASRPQQSSPSELCLLHKPTTRHQNNFQVTLSLIMECGRWTAIKTAA
jgi:hypothetical protein